VFTEVATMTTIRVEEPTDRPPEGDGADGWAAMLRVAGKAPPKGGFAGSLPAGGYPRPPVRAERQAVAKGTQATGLSG
jgi:hypothetical protein